MMIVPMKNATVSLTHEDREAFKTVAKILEELISQIEDKQNYRQIILGDWITDTTDSYDLVDFVSILKDMSDSELRFELE